MTAKKFKCHLCAFLYGFVGGINIVIGLFYHKDFWQVMTGCLFIILLIDRLTISTLYDIMEIKDQKNL